MRWISVIALAVLLAVPQTSLAQAVGTISGTVTGTNGAPISGASVAVAGTTRGDQTDAQGRYTITAVPAGNRVVRATAAGYSEGTRNVSVAAGATATANIPLTAQVVRLEEIVAVGYGTTRRRDVTGSIGSVSAEDIAPDATPVTSVATALVGRSPGVQVVSNSGTPGASATVRIRGTNSITGGSNPLYVIDGIPVGTELSTIDPNNIESVQILKDASATSIYGARGANGVVLVTTKRGTRGTNQVVLETSYGIQKPTKFIQALNTQQFRTLKNEGLVNAGSQPAFNAAQLAETTYFDYPRALLNNLDWQPQQTHALTISGGDATTRYLVSGNFLDQDGLIVNSGYNRFGGRVNLDRTVSSKFRIGSSLSGTRSEQALNGSNNTGSGAGNTGITTALEYDPAVLPQDPITGVWNQRVVLNENFLNPYTESVNRSGADLSTAVLGSLFGEFDVMEGMMLRSTVGGNFNFARGQAYSPSYIGSGNNLGTATQRSDESRELTSSTTLQYRRDLGPGALDVLVGADVQTSHFERFTAESRGFPVDQLEFYNLGAGSTIIAPTSTTTDWTLLSQLGRINYNLLERYLFTVTGRRDGSSRFGENNKWAFFPSAAFAWRVIDEPLLQNQNIFSDLKFRISYGRTGNQAIGPYQSLAQLSTVFFSQGTGTDVVTLAPTTAAANPDLQWETQDQYNVGADFGFFDNRVSVTADAYQSNTNQLLLDTNLPYTTGFSTQLRNVGAVRNRGVELSVSTINWEGDFFTWSTTLNLSANRNQVSELYGGLTALAPFSTTQVGQPLNTFVGYKVLGLYQQGDACNLIATRECLPGEYKLQDTNGDRVVNDNDRVNLGNPQADFYGGFNSDMSFGPLSLAAFFNFSKGNDINAQGAMRYIGLVGGASNERADRALRRWTPTNTNTDVPRANILRPNNRTYSTYIEDGSFARLQTLSVAYQIPTQYIPGGAVDNARLTVTGQNLWTTTKYTGWDPENANNGNDNGGYPKAKTWNVGLNLTF